MRDICRKGIVLIAASSRLAASLSSDILPSSSAINIDVQATIDLQLKPQPVIHTVEVGTQTADSFCPRYVTAAIGDIIRFQLSHGNHSVTQSSFEEPCQASSAFDTSFLGESHRTRGPVDLLVTTTDSQWFFCRQNASVTHCEEGMVFAINPRSQWEGFLQRAGQQVAAKSEGTIVPVDPRASPITNVPCTTGPSVPPSGSVTQSYVYNPCVTASYYLHSAGTASGFAAPTGCSAFTGGNSSTIPWAWPGITSALANNAPVTGDGSRRKLPCFLPSLVLVDLLTLIALSAYVAI